MYKYLSILVFSILITSSVCAAELIQPFGDIKWDDNVVEYIKKINSRPGIEKTIITIGMINTYTEKPIDISLVDDEAIRDSLSLILAGFDSIYDTSALYSYKDSDGDNPTYTGSADESGGHIEIDSKPILVNNIPFEIRARYKSSAGLMVKNKKSVPIIGNKYLPYYLEAIELYSMSNHENADSLIKIKDIIYNKYKKFLVKDCKITNRKIEKGEYKCEQGYEDKKKKTRLDLSVNGNSMKIIYKNQFAGTELYRTYEQYLKSLERKRYQDKRDSSKDL